jgi:hypothetical protein
MLRRNWNVRYLTTVSGNETSEARIIRDKAYVLLKNVMTEIREYGRHAFYRDREHAAEYNVSTYRKTVTRRKKEDAEKTEPVDVPLNAAA